MACEARKGYGPASGAVASVKGTVNMLKRNDSRRIAGGVKAGLLVWLLGGPLLLIVLVFAIC